MITRLDLEERVREWGLREEVVEKDYVLGWILWGIGSDERLSHAWVFKGDIGGLRKVMLNRAIPSATRGKARHS